MSTLAASDLSADQASALEALILGLADSKRLMGIRYSDWTLGAPSIETGIAASSMTQDEWGHARLLYSMLKALGVDPSVVEHERPGDEYASMSVLDHQLPDWAAVVAVMALADGGLSVVLDSFARGTYDAATNRVPKMLAEEEFHTSLGASWFRRLAESAGEGRDLLAAATTKMLPRMLTWVARDDEATTLLVGAGILESAEVRVAAYRDRVRPLVALIDIDVDQVDASSAWDSARGRAPGRPDEEAVERARGDRNRALLVD